MAEIYGNTTATPMNPDMFGGSTDGFSPIANLEETDSGAVITIIDKNGTTTANIKNGSNTNCRTTSCSHP